MRRFVSSKRIIGFICSCVICVGCEGIGSISGGKAGDAPGDPPPDQKPAKSSSMDFPLPLGEDEGGVFGFFNTDDPLKDSGLNDIYYLRVVIQKDDGTGSVAMKSGSIVDDSLNLSTKHSITVFGTKVVFKKGPDSSGYDNGLYEKINNDEMLSNLTIYAERVEIHNKLTLPGANVKIHAKELVFAKNNDDDKNERAAIDTSGKPSVYATARPQTFTSTDASATVVANGYVGTDGNVINSKPGQNAGNIELHIKACNTDYLDPSYSDDSSGSYADQRFICKGADGEYAGLGKDGTNGTDVQTVWDAVEKNTSEIKHITIQHIYSATYWETPQKSLSSDEKFKEEAIIKYKGIGPWGESSGWEGSTIPTNGIDAIASGKPGNGGNGGNISSTQVIDANTSNIIGGKSGLTGTNFSGGRHGYPRRSVEAAFRDVTICTYGDSNTNNYYGALRDSYNVILTTHDGANAIAPSADKPKGDDGKYIPIAKKYSYLHPYMLKQVIAKMRDAFIRGYRDYTLNSLNAYIDLLETYQADPEWDALDSKTRDELYQASAEMKQLAQKLLTGLDYFGNPPGWTPMVSLEVTMSAFEKEIGKSILTMYLKYWLSKDYRNSTDIRESCITLRDNAKNEIESLKEEYTTALGKLSNLNSDAMKKDGEITQVQKELQDITDKLMKKAKDQAEGDKFGKICGAASNILKACPVGQPYTSCASMGLGFIAKESEGKMDSLGDIASFASSYKDCYLADITKESVKGAWSYTKEMDGPLLGKIDFFYNQTGNAWEYNTNEINNTSLLKSAKAMYNVGKKELPAAFKKQAVPSSVVDKILARLKAESWDYNEILRKQNTLLKEKAEIVEKTMQVNEQITEIMTKISIDMQIIKQMSAYIATNGTIGFGMVMAYVDEMDRQARERLLLYQYYMGKAYEYRMLKRYTGNLTVQNVFNKILEQYEQVSNTGTIGTSRLLSDAQFSSLKSIYQEEIQKVVQEMYTNKINNPPSYGMPMSFRLSDTQIEDLNNFGYIMINPVKMNLFYPTEENIRIAGIRINFATDCDGTFTGNSGYVDLKMTHNGNSVLDCKGSRYLFRNYNSRTENYKSWLTRKDMVYGTISYSKPGSSEATLFKTLMGNMDSDLSYYSLPSARSDMKLEKRVHTSNGQPINVKNVVIEIEYEYSEFSGCSMTKVLAANDTLTPLVTVSSDDMCGQNNGYGFFTRTYSIGTDPVTFSVPAVYGEWKFSQWTDESSNMLSTSPSITISNDGVRVIRPVYVRTQ